MLRVNVKFNKEQIYNCIMIEIGDIMIFLRRKKNPLEIAKNEAEQVIEVTSPAFKHGERIPRKYTCEGEDISPPLRFENIPDNTAELALIMYDPDAPIGIFHHWLLYDIV